MPYRSTAAIVLCLAVCQPACTFITNQPDAPPCVTNAGGAQATGGATGGGTPGVGGALSHEAWTNVTANLAGLESDCGNLGFVALKPKPGVLITGIAKQGLWSSDDGGQSWVQLGKDKDSALLAHRPSSIVFDPDEPTRFWESGIYGHGVFRTDDD